MENVRGPLKSVEKIFAFLRLHSGAVKAVAIALAGVLLISLGSGTDRAESLAEDELTRQVREFCESIDGVGECRVMISYERAEGGYFSSGGEQRVTAVAVACRGAGSVKVREALTELLTTLFGIGSNRVSIFRLD